MATFWGVSFLSIFYWRAQIAPTLSPIDLLLAHVELLLLELLVACTSVVYHNLSVVFRLLRFAVSGGCLG